MQKHPDMKRPHTLLFDWDGTLADSYGFLNDAHAHVLSELGFPPFRENEFKDYFGKPREILYKHIYKERSEDAKTLFEIYVNANGHRLEPMPHAEKMLRAFAALDITMGVVSNKKGTLVRKEIENFGWTSLFDSVIAAGEAEADKPSGAPLLLAIKQLGLNAGQSGIWYVGDTEIDLLSAKEAGCPSVLLAPNGNEKIKIKEYNPIMVAANCLKIQEFLVALNP